MKWLTHLRSASVFLAISSVVLAGNDPQRLTAADAATGQGFGSGVDISGDVLVVGAPGDGDLGAGAGAVYVFERQAGAWVQVLKITAPDGAAGHNFGSDVALDGALLAVAARGRVQGPITGGVYIYSLVGSSWVYDTVIVPPLASPNILHEEFALNVEVSGQRVAVRGYYWGEFGYLHGRFHVYSYQGTWNREFHVDHYAMRRMGFDGDTLIPGDTASHGSILQRGYVHVYDKDVPGGNWSFAGTYHGDSQPGRRDHFGAAIAVDDDAKRFAVAVPSDTEDSSAVYFFRRNAGQWEREARVSPVNAGGIWGVESSLALSGEWMLAAWGSGVLVFRYDGAEWAEDHLLSRPPGADLFGAAVRADESTAAVGAVGYDGVAPDIGAVFVYELDPPVTRYCSSTINSSGQAARIDVSGTTSIMANDMVLTVTHCPVGTFGLFFYGQQAANFPLGDGRLCVSPFAPGLFRIPPTVQVDLNGRATLALDFLALPGAGQIQGGDTWNFQCWFRDSAPGGSGSNLSDAIRVIFCP